MSPVGVEPQYVLEQYEAVRRDALEVGPFGPRGHGLALLVTRGLPAWLTALTALVPSTPTRRVDEPRAEQSPRLLPAARVELTTVLAGLVLACAEPRKETAMMATSSKVTSEHLRRLAYLYVRQSSLQQVHDHRESTARQYDLKRRAQALGWPSDQIVVIDEDLGLSGASSVERNGFQRLVAEVGLGRVGVVMGLEVSRLARNSTDWHRLLEICALAETLILDEDGIYDPSHFNDRLLLGLKGTMSEAELHVLRARLLGGQLNKARRGELWMRPPIGFVIDGAGRLSLDPDAQIQDTVRLLFETFRRTGSALKVVRHFARENILWPRRLLHGWPCGPARVRPPGAQSSPRDSPQSAVCRGVRVRPHSSAQGDHRRPAAQPAPDSCGVEGLSAHAHPGYLTWEEYEANQATLLVNAAGYGTDRRRSPAREGVALLQGVVICGALRPPDDRAVFRPARPSRVRVRLPAAGDRDCGAGVSDHPRHRSGRGCESGRARGRDTSGARCGTGGLR